ncbi:MAG: TetR family transcriptional regulator C-terminal domain-containing protein [Gracilibacteraceae bacterium]|jgi:AcrR family transcriptional regulator|nr:TetR family transcriptional regulator C-terminal domain-containing protein [Gracilibacteraceae bacterium]
MKRESANLRTKTMLAASLKKLLHKKPLHKVSISELAAGCELDRKTFYYHFSDINDLFVWLMHQEVYNLFRQIDFFDDPEGYFTKTMNWLDINGRVFASAFESLGWEGMRRILHPHFVNVILAVIESAEERFKLNVSREFKNFLADFYTHATEGTMVINAIKGEYKDNWPQVLRYATKVYLAIPQILAAEVER